MSSEYFSRCVIVFFILSFFCLEYISNMPDSCRQKNKYRTLFWAVSRHMVDFFCNLSILRKKGVILVKIPHTQGDVACNTYRNRYLKPTQPSRLGLPLALWFVRIQARCHLCSHNSTWKSFRVAAASGHLTGTAYGQAVKP